MVKVLISYCQTKIYIVDHLTKKKRNFAFILSEENTNKYL